MVDIGWANSPTLVVTLGRDFQPIRVVAEDNLAPVVQRALESHVIDRDFTTPERLEEYMHEVKRIH